MGLALVFGVGITVIVFMLFTRLINGEKHEHIKNFLLIIIFPLLFLIPASLVLDQTVCEVVLNSTYNTYQYGNNFTGYHWDYDTGTAPDGPQTDAYVFHINTTNTYDNYCYDKANGSQGFLRAYVIILIVVMTYIFIVFFTDILKALKNIVRKV